ncbi:MAG: allantoate amidohydrolase [Alphaproteobacteria bacterium]
MNSIDPAGAAIMERIDALARLSERPDGLARRCFTPEHRRANDLVGAWMQGAGMDVHEDAIGNIIGRYEGESEGLPAVMIGSHLDTVVMAGKYDGMLGVLTGIACVDALNRTRKRLPFAIEVAGFADEEGVRFASTYLGSSAVTGGFDPALLERRDADGITLADAMKSFGLDPDRIGDAARNRQDIHAYLEVHIEQGPVLENENLPVGAVSGISGATRLLICIEGEAGHAGTVPMGMRRDALAAAAQCMSLVETVASDAGSVVATIGKISALPGAANVIPGRVDFCIDLRAPIDAVRADALEKIQTGFARIAERRGVTVKSETVHNTVSTSCNVTLMSAIAASIEACGWRAMTMPSGAGHDAVAMADLAPVGMIFVRCEGGISHNPAENITSADAKAGVDVLSHVLNNFPASIRS